MGACCRRAAWLSTGYFELGLLLPRMLDVVRELQKHGCIPFHQLIATFLFELKTDVHTIHSPIRRPDCRAYADQSRQPDRGAETDTGEFIHRVENIGSCFQPFLPVLFCKLLQQFISLRIGKQGETRPSYCSGFDRYARAWYQTPGSGYAVLTLAQGRNVNHFVLIRDRKPDVDLLMLGHFSYQVERYIHAWRRALECVGQAEKHGGEAIGLGAEIILQESRIDQRARQAAHRGPR